jgi:hypothetical protein
VRLLWLQGPLGGDLPLLCSYQRPSSQGYCQSQGWTPFCCLQAYGRWTTLRNKLESTVYEQTKEIHAESKLTWRAQCMSRLKSLSHCATPGHQPVFPHHAGTRHRPIGPPQHIQETGQVTQTTLPPDQASLHSQQSHHPPTSLHLRLLQTLCQQDCRHLCSGDIYSTEILPTSTASLSQ